MGTEIENIAVITVLFSAVSKVLCSAVSKDAVHFAMSTDTVHIAVSTVLCSEVSTVTVLCSVQCCQ